MTKRTNTPKTPEAPVALEQQEPRVVNPADVNQDEGIPEQHPTATVTVDDEPSIEQTPPAPEGVVVTSLEDPKTLHDTIAAAVGEPVIETAPEPTAEVAAEEMVKVVVTDARVDRYVTCSIGGKSRSINFAGITGFDEATSTIKLTRAQAIKLKLAS